MKSLVARRIIMSIAAIAVCSISASANEVVETPEDLGKFEVIDQKEKFRNRTNAIAPILEYNREFFERYEPTTAGEMLKRVPGVVFKGDVGEYDFIQFRGMASGYTQVLVNGKRIPGNIADRGVNLDRIPAEMVERIEIIRSPSVEIDSQGVAGTINIILKDGSSMQGGMYRVGVSRHSNGKDNPWTETKYKPNAYLSYSEDLDTFSYTVSAYYQERYNAKDKVTNEHEDAHDDKDSWVYTEDEWDNRETKDASLYAKFDIDVTEDDRLMLSANYFNTDREEEQYEFKNERDAVSDPFELYKLEHQIMDIDETSFNFDSEYVHSFESMDELKIGLTYDHFEGTLDEKEAKEKSDNIEDWKKIKNIEAADHSVELTETTDDEIKASIGYSIQGLESHKVIFGLQSQLKKRDTSFVAYDVEDGIAEDAEEQEFGTYKIDETRLDFYAQDTWKITENSSLQFGGRIEYTAVDQEGVETKKSNDYTYFNPSIHYKLGLTSQDQIRLSVAQTLRRPNFDEMVPFSADDEPADYDLLVGNPDLIPEKSLGADLGYEHSFIDQFGIIGANIFYRNIEDKIENHYLGENSVEDDGEIMTGGLYTPDNIGDGVTYGFELDTSFPLTFIGVPSVSFFGNYSYLDSEIEDPYTKETRRFNDQPDYVYNVGLSHTLKSAGLSYGFSYQKRGDSTYEDPVTTETTSYDANLEAYVEYKVMKAMTLRLTGDNLLDADVTEHMKNYDSLDDKIAGKVDNYETQIERSGAVFMLTLSGRF